MFEQTDETVDKTRSRIIMALAGLGVAMLLAALLLFGRFNSEPPAEPPPPPRLANAQHAGDPDFDKYSGLVAIVNKKFFTQSNMLGQRQAVIQGTLANFSDRPLVGVELRGTVLGVGGAVMATTVAMPVPKKYNQVPPKGSVPFAVTVDGVPAEGEIEDITIALEGLVMGQ